MQAVQMPSAAAATTGSLGSLQAVQAASANLGHAGPATAQPQSQQPGGLQRDFLAGSSNSANMLALQQLLAVHAQQQQQQQQSGGGLPSTNGASGRNNSLVWKNALRVGFGI